ncbi:hypothetical protein Zm00014a_010581 [Zea mays]|uniref:Uncharacterized protein n=1 Tax=Zea mays TaxID=4577 RepID=A0A317Y1E7_MAIZE|nr:hypothetical protein Zm00014a_010581 [Zea mays]
MSKSSYLLCLYLQLSIS